MSAKIPKEIKTALKILVSLSGLALIFYKVPFASVYGHWHASALPWLLLMLLATFFSMLIQANRWKGLLLEAGKLIPFRTYYAYIALGYFFNNLLPGGFGGDAVKSVALGKRFKQTAQSVAAILVSRITGLLAMFLCFFIALPFVLARYAVPLAYTLTMVAATAVSVAVIAGCLFADKLNLPRMLREKITFLPKLQNAFSLYRGHHRQFMLSALDSVWLQLLSVFIHYSYFRAVGLTVDIATITVFTAITITIAMIPVSINGIGIREGVQVSLYTGLLHIPADVVLSASLLGYILTLFQVVQGAFVFAAGKRGGRSA